MYSENNRRATARRADDDFLRRMLGGELTADGYPTLASVQRPGDAREACNVTEKPQESQPGGMCPTHLFSPSLAMVYSPAQCFRKLYDPASALAHGTLFEELALPLEIEKRKRTEVNTRRLF